MPAIREPKEVNDFLRAHGVKPSYIRLKVMQYLFSTRDHPNADSIYRKISREVPTLSRTSVYNTLKAFTGAGIVKEVMTEENEIRYDAFTERHGHFKCVACGSLEDVELKCVSCCEGKDSAGRKIFDEQVYMFGLCASCAKKAADKETASGN
ncbi:MAG TPA: Fur family transcriptional regulator [Candidatus Goldiibacteriota bacterium]|nr:Fur family transcriptional regulator [Candidatus Goldiibacteriota bacterium]